MNQSLKRLHDLQEVDLQIVEVKQAIAAIDDGARARTLLESVQQQLASNQAALQEIERQIRASSATPQYASRAAEDEPPSD